MNEFAVTILNDALKEYYDHDELEKMCYLFDVDSEIDDYDKAYFDLALKLIINIEIGNNHILFKTIYDSLILRSKKQIATTQWEKREYHQDMLDRIQIIAPIVEELGLPSEISVSEKRPFSAKSEARDLLKSAETEITIVDPYVGPATLDCLREVLQPVRLLTGNRSNNISSGFDNVLREFRTENRHIEVRRHDKLHDRYISFNDRCWLVGSSLKDAGKKSGSSSI